MSNYRLFGLRSADDLAIRSIGQIVPSSNHVGRYGLGDSDKFRFESTTSINWQRLSVANTRGGAARAFCVVAIWATQLLVIGATKQIDHSKKL